MSSMLFNHFNNLQDLVQSINSNYNENGFTSYNYNLDNICEFKGNEVPYKSDSVGVEIIAKYTYALAAAIINLKTDIVEDPIIRSQLIRANREGILCHYITVIQTELIRTLTSYNAQMVQGYCNFKTQFGIEQLGLGDFLSPMDYYALHTFAVFNDDCVLDSCFYLENPDFSGNSLCIMGYVPEGLQLNGWIEPIEIEYKYAKMFASWNNMLVSEWRLLHLDALGKIVKQLKTQD